MNDENLSKEYRFSSTNQPDPKLKLVPKWKTQFKKMLNKTKNLQAFEKQLEKGNIKAWDLALNRIHGSVKSRLDLTSKGEKVNLSEKDIDDLIQEKIKILNAKTD